jgi:hypothetical protein
LRKLRQEELEAVLKLSDSERYLHFVKRVVDEQRAWGLWDEGWALMDRIGGGQVFPLWPAQEYADVCRIEVWRSYQPEEIPLQSLMVELLPKLKARGIQPGVFPTTASKAVTPTVDELSEALQLEMARYE